MVVKLLGKCYPSCFGFFNKPIDTFVTNSEVLLVKDPSTYAALVVPVRNRLSQ